MEVEIQFLSSWKLCVVFIPQLCQWYWCSLNTQHHNAGGLCLSLQVLWPSSDCWVNGAEVMAALQVTQACFRWAPVSHWDWMPSPCWGRPAVLAVPIPVCCDGNQSTVHREGRAGPPSPACLGLSLGASQSLTAAGSCGAQSSHQSSCQMGYHLSQNYLKVHHDDSGFQSPSNSKCWSLSNLNCQPHEGKSCSRYPNTHWPAALWSSNSSAYWFLFVVQCRRGGILAAVKEPTAA